MIASTDGSSTTMARQRPSTDSSATAQNRLTVIPQLRSVMRRNTYSTTKTTSPMKNQ